MLQIGLVDDHRLFRKSLALLISTIDNAEVVLQAGNGKELLEQLESIAVDLVLLDIQMPEMDGFETCKQLRKHYPDIKILIISQLTTRESIHKVMELGANGFFSKDAEPEKLEKAIRDIRAKDYFFDDDLASVIRDHQLPIPPFRDLLSAFKQDVVVTRYQDFPALLDYCRRSANPVGTIMLHLYQAASQKNIEDSNAICSALQLINFWQDIAVDRDKQRIYLPQEDLEHFHIDEQQIAGSDTHGQWQEMMRFQTDRARAMMMRGAPLCRRLPGRIGWELRLVVQGGLRILERIDDVNGDIFTKRPRLNKFDWLCIFWRAVLM